MVTTKIKSMAVTGILNICKFQHDKEKKQGALYSSTFSIHFHSHNRGRKVR